MTEIAFIALGSNLGDRSSHLRAARTMIGMLPETRILAESAIEETSPLEGMPQPLYLNQMIAVETDLSPRALLERLHEIERARGRTRGPRWASRTLDLDLVLFGAVHTAGPDLTLPHPGLATRDFWQRELAALRAALASRV
jgi:2-amino-4-hydroxy-6-hydroxymethyldihydropteridine diphosphokinase